MYFFFFFIAIQAMEDASKNLQNIFHTKNPSTLCIGYCETELETIFLNFIEENDKILICVIGEIGKRAINAANKIDAIVHTVEAYAGKILDYETIEREMIKYKPTILFIAHGENSTGVLQPVDRLGELCEKYSFFFFHFFCIDYYHVWFLETNVCLLLMLLKR